MPSHTFDPNVYCAACDESFPKGSSGCHRLNPRLTGARYQDDSESMKRNGENTRQATPDPWSKS